MICTRLHRKCLVKLVRYNKKRKWLDPKEKICILPSTVNKISIVHETLTRYIMSACKTMAFANHHIYNPLIAF